MAICGRMVEGTGMVLHRASQQGRAFIRVAGLRSYLVEGFERSSRTALLCHPIILRNPIYIGWKVYERKRDGSSKGKKLDAHGHLQYQRKLKRSADEVLRVKLIKDGLISDAMWARAQQLIATKRE